MIDSRQLSGRCRRAILAAIVILLVSSCESRATVSHEMTWQIEEGADAWGDENVVLTFVSYPEDYVEISATNLGDYLRTLPNDRVVAMFELTTVAGCRRYWKLIKVNDRCQWHYGSELAWTTGGAPRAPWDETLCLLPWR